MKGSITTVFFEKGTTVINTSYYQFLGKYSSHLLNDPRIHIQTPTKKCISHPKSVIFDIIKLHNGFITYAKYKSFWDILNIN